MSTDEAQELTLPAVRLSDVMARMAVNVDKALRPENRGALARASQSCLACEHGDCCDRWIFDREEGERHGLPPFCPNGTYLCSLSR